MEQNAPVVAKKVWSFIRTILFMIRKNISKRKLLLDLNIMMKRGKVAGKSAVQNLRLHHHHHRRSPTEHYEFSCSKKQYHNHKNTTLHKKKKLIHDSIDYKEYDHDEIYVDPAVIKVLEMLTSAAASPAVPGFGKLSPMVVKELRITDSPVFPLGNVEEDSSSHVDEAAEKFIMKFYNDLRRQN